jgi:hypothetical protein
MTTFEDFEMAINESLDRHMSAYREWACSFFYDMVALANEIDESPLSASAKKGLGDLIDRRTDEIDQIRDELGKDLGVG